MMRFVDDFFDIHNNVCLLKPIFRQYFYENKRLWKHLHLHFPVRSQEFD